MLIAVSHPAYFDYFWLVNTMLWNGLTLSLNLADIQ